MRHMTPYRLVVMTTVTSNQRPPSADVAPAVDVAGRPGPGRPRWLRPAAPGSVERRLVDAVEACACRWGIDKTTVADIAREAGISRATLYRAVPGGREALIEAHHRHRLAEFFGRLDAAVAGIDDLAELLTAIVQRGAEMLADDAGLQHRRLTAPDEVSAELSFRGLDRIFAAARISIGPLLEPHVGARRAGRCAEWLARLVLCSAADGRLGVDLTSPEAAHRLVRERLVPALTAGDALTPGASR